MSAPLVFYGLVILSAVAHPIWNAMMKSSGDRTLSMVAIRTTGLTLGLLALPFVDWPQAAALPWLGLTAAAHFAYYVLLIRSYDIGDLGVVYPLARGLAPVLTSLLAFAIVGEALSRGQWAAVGLVSLGIMALSLGAGASRAATGFALATGVTVAAYSFLGGVGVRAAGSVLGFQACLEIVTGSGVVLFALLRRSRDLLPYARRHGGRGALAGTISVVGFLAFLAAASRLPLGPVTALRETSVIFGALIGTLVLKEGFGPRRLVASTAVATGIVLLAAQR